MSVEVVSASNFLVHLVRITRTGVSELQLQAFRDCLVKVLKQNFQKHWYPHKPFKRAGFRCIRIDKHLDPRIKKAGEECGLTEKYLFRILPTLKLWIDPEEVSYRIDDGNVCVLYEYKEGVRIPWAPALNTINKEHFKLPPIKNVKNDKSKINPSSDWPPMDYLLRPEMLGKLPT